MVAVESSGVYPANGGLVVGLTPTQEQIEFLGSRFKEIGGLQFYHYLFPKNERTDEVHDDFSRPNSIYTSQQSSTGKWVSEIMYSDTFDKNYAEYIITPKAQKVVCSGLLYLGKRRVERMATKMRAIIVDLDGVGQFELGNLFDRFGRDPSTRGALPLPTFIASSGTGVHLYYVFTDLIELFPQTKLQLNGLKHDLTFRLWQYGVTSRVESVQYQSINQGFRMVGSINSKYGSRVRVFKTGKEVDITYLNQYVESKVGVEQKFKPSRMTRQQAQDRHPEWYKRVVVDHDTRPQKWDIKGKVRGTNPYALYDWWLRQVDQVRAGHRYYFLFMMAVYACKVDYPRDRLIVDMHRVFDDLKQIEHNNPLVQADIDAALGGYDNGFYHYTLDLITKMTGIDIKPNKRNYLPQKEHLKKARDKKKEMKEQGIPLKNKDGRPEGVESCNVRAVREFVIEHPDWSVAEIEDHIGVSCTTINKIKRECGIKCSSNAKKERVMGYIMDHLDLNTTQLANACGVSRPTVIKHLKEIKGE